MTNGRLDRQENALSTFYPIKYPTSRFTTRARIFNAQGLEFIPTYHFEYKGITMPTI